VLQDKQSSANLATVVIVPLTSNLAAAKFLGSFVISPDAHNGLDVPSVVLTHQIRAIDKKRLQKIIGRLSASDLANLENEVRKLLRL
jgi:mRNA-degrading endonuclease toxin of MazEF toxin-antitoxin module